MAGNKRTKRGERETERKRNLEGGSDRARERGGVMRERKRRKRRKERQIETVFFWGNVSLAS